MCGDKGERTVSVARTLAHHVFEPTKSSNHYQDLEQLDTNSTFVTCAYYGGRCHGARLSTVFPVEKKEGDTHHPPFLSLPPWTL